MLQIGITGGIGSGKSLVCRIFKTLDIPIYNADERAKKITQTNHAVKSKIVKLFGFESYIDSKLNNKYLAQQVFGNKEKLDQLNAIIHPAVATDYFNWKQKYKNKKYILKEAAILFESGSYKFCDKVILVNASEELRIQRVINRDEVTEEEVRKRINNQWSTDKKAALAQYIINNNESDVLLPQVMKIHNNLLSL